jgi:hypothetical protein
VLAKVTFAMSEKDPVFRVMKAVAFSVWPLFKQHWRKCSRVEAAGQRILSSARSDRPTISVDGSLSEMLHKTKEVIA